MQASASPALMWCISRKGESAHSTSATRSAGHIFRNLPTDSGRTKQNRAQDEGADGNQDRRRSDEGVEDQRCARQRREQILNLREIRERADIKAQVHHLQQKEESLHHGVRGPGEFFGRCKNSVARSRLRLLRPLRRF